MKIRSKIPCANHFIKVICAINNNLKICQQQLLYVLQLFITSNSANNSNKVELD